METQISPIQLRLPHDFFRPALFICAPSNPTDHMIDYARHLIGYEWAVHQHFRIITGDGYGVDAEVIRAAQQHGMPIDVFGGTVRPHNGVSLKHYTRLPHRDRDRLARALIAQADKVIVLSDTSPQLEELYQYARAFKQKKVSIKTFSRPIFLH